MHVVSGNQQAVVGNIARAPSWANSAPTATRGPGQKSGLRPGGIIQLPPRPSSAPKTTRTEKARHQYAGCKLMHRKLCDEFSFLGKLAARRSPPPPSSSPAPSLVPSRSSRPAPRRIYLRGFIEPRASERPPPLGWPGSQNESQQPGSSGEHSGRPEPSAPPSSLIQPSALAPPQP